MRKNEGLLWAGRWTSKIGNIVFDYASNISLVAIFGARPWVLALYQSSETLIQVLFNLIGGVKADLGNRKKILITTDLVAAVICLLVSMFVTSNLISVALIAANALLAFVYAFNSPTYKSIVREMIEKPRIVKYNSISNAGSDIVNLVAPLMALVLVGIIGVQGALLFNAATFLISALMEVFLAKIPQTQTSVEKKPSKNTIIEIQSGFVYLWGECQIFILVAISALVNFFLAGHNLLLPYTDLMYGDRFTGFYGKSLTMEALGSIIGAFLVGKLSNKNKLSVRILLIFLLGTGVALMLVPMVSMMHIVICLVPFLLFGICLTMFNIQFMSYIQINADDNYLGRLFSIIFTVAVLFMPLGSFMFSLLGSIDNVYYFLIVGGGIVMLSLCSLIFVKSQMKLPVQMG